MTPATLSVAGVTKTYGRTVANLDVSLDLRSGEVHGLLGENGAGKSTLVGTLTGQILPDQGRISFKGADLPLGSPAAAAKAGIAAVYQHLMLAGSMTGIENLAVGLGQAASQSLRRKLTAISERYDLDLTLDVPVQRLDMAARQRLEFARALCREPSVLILDEPTAFLSPTHIESFLSIVRRLADGGLAVLLITHHLEEARRVCDRVTILRRGAVVSSFARAHLPDNDDIARAMLGKPVTPPKAFGSPGTDIVLAVRQLTTKRVTPTDVIVSEVDLDVRTGEIVGLAGVDGNGQSELLEAIVGLRPSSGTVGLAERDISATSSHERYRSGLQLVPGDRRRHAVVPTFSVLDHFDYVAHGRGHGRERVQSLLHDYEVSPPNPDLPAAALSGGNQQKVIVARAFLGQPRILLLAYPTQGLDLSAAARIQSRIMEQARQGVGFLIVSGDVDELFTLCDRIAVMYRGRIVGVQKRDELDPTVLANWFTGVAVV